MEYTPEEINDILSNYHWMIKEVHQLKELLAGTEQKVTAQYGVEATLPKPKGLTNNPIENEVIRNDKRRTRRIQFLQKIQYVQNRMYVITDEREKVVLDCLLDGMSINAISHHMGLSRRHIHRLKDSIACKMSHMSQSLQSKQEIK